VKNLRRVLLFILLFGTMLIFGIIENIKGVSYPLIKEQFNASWEQQGLMVSMLSIAYVGFSVIAGIFLGRFGIKPSFLFGFSALCAGLFSMFFMPGFFLTAAALFVVFAGFGFFEVGINALATRLFITKAALLMNLLHSFYGIGAMIGPKAAGLIAGDARFGWRYVYLFSLPLALAFFIPTIFIRFPEENPGTDSVAGQSSTEGFSPLKIPRKSFFDALKSPVVWLMSVTLGLCVTVEMSTSNWGVMYFNDVYKINPNTDGASFLSAFFLLFTVSRLVCGLFVEKIGYMRTLLFSAFIVLAVFTAGFLLGEKGIYLLPSLGFFVAQFWPTLMAVAIVSFGGDAPVFSSAMIAISGLLNAAIQFIIGLTNKIFGPAWGYRSTVVYTLLLIVALGMLHRKLGTRDRCS
jgi:fucose permease